MPISLLQERVRSLTSVLEDYRGGGVCTTARVERWIAQFNPPMQVPMLEELEHVFRNTYANKEDGKRFLGTLLEHKPLVGNDPRAFWRQVEVLDIQQHGLSQRELAALFSELLRCELGIDGVSASVSGPKTCLYLDDGIFSGNRLLRDLDTLIPSVPRGSRIVVVVMGLYREGHWYVEKNLSTLSKDRDLQISFFSAKELENRRAHAAQSDVFWPSCLPDDDATRRYADTLAQGGHPPALRPAGVNSHGGVFSGEMGRHLLEQELLKASCRIRERSQNLTESQRPLGHTALRTLGFGSTLVTWRNCPNSCPLAFWAEGSWFPLFPRQTNAESALVTRLRAS